MTKFRTAYNYAQSESDYERNEGVSLTVPNQSYTIRELMAKHASGSLPLIGKEGTFEDEPDIDHVNPLENPAADLVDKLEMQQQLAAANKRLAAAKKQLESKKDSKIELEKTADSKDAEKTTD